MGQNQGQKVADGGNAELGIKAMEKRRGQMARSQAVKAKNQGSVQNDRLMVKVNELVKKVWDLESGLEEHVFYLQKQIDEMKEKFAKPKKQLKSLKGGKNE